MATTIRKSDLPVFDGLSVVGLDGFEPAKQMVTVRAADGVEWTMRGDQSGIDMPGSANWLCDSYGMNADLDPERPGVLWSDYDAPEGHPWRFSVLIASDEVEDLTTDAREAGYTVCGVAPVTEPIHYGDGSGTVAILKHPDGWCVLG